MASMAMRTGRGGVARAKRGMQQRGALQIAVLAGGTTNGGDDVAFPLSVQGRHTGFLISEFNGWPASPRSHATPGASPLPA